ncbi:MAG: aminotransferase class I/II-fold pyridoxal phosphate-dependent enzyme [Pseudomonadota bacterium]
MEDSKSLELLEKYYLDCGFTTRTVHAGEHVGQPQQTSHTGAIYQTSTFVFKDVQEGADIFGGQKTGYMYTRLGNPTVLLLEAKINALEGAEVKKQNPDLRVSTIAFSSGMSAVASTLLALASQGDTIIIGDVIYGATEHLAFNVLNRYGINTVEVNTANLEAVEETVKNNPNAKCLLFETPTNPMLVVSDIKKICEIVKAINPEMKSLS